MFVEGWQMANQIPICIKTENGLEYCTEIINTEIAKEVFSKKIKQATNCFIESENKIPTKVEIGTIEYKDKDYVRYNIILK